MSLSPSVAQCPKLLCLWAPLGQDGDLVTGGFAGGQAQDWYHSPALSAPLFLPGGPPRPVPRGRWALERLVPLQAPCHGQLPGSRGKGASTGVQKAALPLRGCQQK